tara:strand:+ start:235 stop:474 length:240 start_codon:yes stop_codon:yes gene_type:complete
MTENELLNIVSNSLDVPREKININSSSQNLEEWDSLGHLAILTAIDKATQGKASEIETLASSSSLFEIFEILKKHNIAK